MATGTTIPWSSITFFTANQSQLQPAKVRHSLPKGSRSPLPVPTPDTKTFCFQVSSHTTTESRIFHYGSVTHDFPGNGKNPSTRLLSHIQQKNFWLYSLPTALSRQLPFLPSLPEKEGVLEFILRNKVISVTAYTLHTPTKRPINDPNPRPLTPVLSFLNRRTVVNSIQTEGLTSKTKASVLSSKSFKFPPRGKSFLSGYCNQHASTSILQPLPSVSQPPKENTQRSLGSLSLTASGFDSCTTQDTGLVVGLLCPGQCPSHAISKILTSATAMPETGLGPC